MKISRSPRPAVTIALTLLAGLVPLAEAQIFTEWSAPVNLTALNSSAADA